MDGTTVLLLLLLCHCNTFGMTGGIHRGSTSLRRWLTQTRQHSREAHLVQQPVVGLPPALACISPPATSAAALQLQLVAGSGRKLHLHATALPASCCTNLHLHLQLLAHPPQASTLLSPDHASSSDTMLSCTLKRFESVCLHPTLNFLNVPCMCWFNLRGLAARPHTSRQGAASTFRGCFPQSRRRLSVFFFCQWLAMVKPHALAEHPCMHGTQRCWTGASTEGSAVVQTALQVRSWSLAGSTLFQYNSLEISKHYKLT